MKLSIEAKVAAAVAAGFVALTVGSIAQGNATSQAGVPGGYRTPNTLRDMSQEGYDISLTERTDAQENRHTFSAKNETGTSLSSGRKHKNLEPRKHHIQHIRRDQRAETI
jgi:hypothetical protein